MLKPGMLLLIFLTIFSFTTYSLPRHMPANAELNQDAAWSAMAMIPDNEQSRTELSYANYQALQEIWGVSDVTYANVINGTDAGRAWFAAMQSFVSALNLSALRTGMAELDPETVPFPNMLDTLGFTMLEVDQAAVYGWPPGKGQLLIGDFDFDSIRAAYANRGYQPTTMNGVEVLCPPAGCDQGLQQDLEHANPTNFFGGNIGRSESLALLPGILLDSAVLEVLEDLIAMQQEGQPSLIDASEYQTFLEALADQGQIIQFWVFDPAAIKTSSGDNYDLMTWNFNEIQLPEEIWQNTLDSAKTFGELPPYALFGFAHIWNGSEHLSLWVLICDDAAHAQAAANELYFRLTTGTSFRGRSRTYYDIISENSEILPPATYEGSEGAAALFITRSLPSDDPETAPMASVMAYRYFVTMISNRDLYFLGTEFIFP